MKTNSSTRARLILVAALICVMIGSSAYLLTSTATSTPPAAQIGTTSFTADQLAEYDGTDPQKPIYLAMDGLVYDVTAGRSYYETGGSYHYLAGKDATAELHIAGGSLIKRKYPVVGTLQTQ